MKNSVSENRTECIRQAKIVHECHGHREFLASSNLENSRQYLLLRKHVLRKTGRATRLKHNLAITRETYSSIAFFNGCTLEELPRTE